MKKRIYIFIQSLILIFISYLLVNYQDRAVTSAFVLLAIYTFFRAIFKFFILPYSIIKNKSKKWYLVFLEPVFDIIMSIIIIIMSSFQTYLIAWLVALYTLVLGFVYLFSFYLLVKDKVSAKKSLFFNAIFHIIFGLSGIMNIREDAKIVYLYLGIYIFVLAFNLLLDAVYFYDYNNSGLHRRSKKSLPIILTAMIPYKHLKEYADSNQSYNFERTDLEVWIHTSKNPGDMFGHVDISYKGKIYCYGHYDVDSDKFRGLGAWGDGTIWTLNTNHYKEWLESYEEKSVYRYGIKLSDEQKLAVENRIDNIFKDTYEIELKTNSQKESYIGQMASKYSDLKIYKFRKTKFKTYFVLTTNCVALADSIIGNSGIDFIDKDGIITPGAYQNYFEKEFIRENSNVISKEVIL